MTDAGLIGYGYWGANLARNLAVTAGIRLAAIADASPTSLERAKQLYPGVKLYPSGLDLIADESLAAVVIAAPLASHYSLSKAAIERGKHVLVEKPMAASPAEADALVELADQQHVRLAVDHTFIYSGAIRKLRSILAEGSLGELLYWDSVRVNFGLFRNDANVIWDLAAHDLAIADYAFPDRPAAVSATAVRFGVQPQEALAHVNLFFESGFTGHLHLNWLSPEKVRRMVICGSKGMAVYDDLRSGSRLRLYEKSVSIGSTGQEFEYRSRNVVTPTIDRSEPLSLLTLAFSDAIRTGREIATGGRQGARVVSLLAAADCSARNGGELVRLMA
jgi:predicted dehydrogenase